jgi:dUTP pyrophosphatase
MEFDIKILDARLHEWGFPHRGSSLAAGLDLYACLDAPVHLHPQSSPVLISAGFAVYINDPEWCGFIYPRSGLAHHAGLVLGNSVGVIDADYIGPCLISAWNRNAPSGRRMSKSDNIVTINPGDRIAQLVFARVAHPRFRYVTEFGRYGARGAGGFGSTG